VTDDAAAFFSYVRMNDDHDNGRLSELRQRLSAEVQIQTGTPFPIFQDRNDILWGQNWQRRIDATLETVTLLVPVLTPSFFQSPACRDETERFLRRERELGRDDLILPIYYVSSPLLDDAAARAGDPLATELATRQLADWRELRFEPMTSAVIGKAIAKLAERLRDAFWKPPDAPAPATTRPPARRTAADAPDSATTQPSARRTAPDAPDPATTRSPARRTTPDAPPSTADAVRTVAKTEPPTLVVDPWGRGDHTTIGRAIEVAAPGSRVLVRPGLYQEGLVVDKPLEIIGDGPVGDIEVHARGADALLFTANIGRVSNLTLRQLGGGEWFGVDITQGRLELENCDISSRSFACVAIRNGADPRLRGNRIHDGAEGGVFVLDDGLGTLEDNDISGNRYSGVEIKAGGNPTLRRNRIHDNLESGVFVQDALGIVEDNDITGHPDHGVEIREGRPTFRRNRINNNAPSGIRITEDGGGLFEDNDLTGNAEGAWDIDPACRAQVTSTRNTE
jgi:parallel beta-helix repeat protein